MLPIAEDYELAEHAERSAKRAEPAQRLPLV